MNSYYKNIFPNNRDYNMTQSTMALRNQPPALTQPPKQTQPQASAQQQTQMQRSSQEALSALMEQYTYPQNLQNALQLILDALNKEAEDAQFYQYLVNQAPTQEEKNVIINIQKDELNHYYLIGQIYARITGTPLPAPQQFAGNVPVIRNYCQGLYEAFLGEIEDGSKYRKILFAMQDRTDINIITDIVADEIEHASLYSFLYSKNNCGNVSRVQF